MKSPYHIAMRDFVDVHIQWVKDSTPVREWFSHPVLKAYSQLMQALPRWVSYNSYADSSVLDDSRVVAFDNALNEFKDATPELRASWERVKEVIAAS